MVELKIWLNFHKNQILY